MRARAIDLHGTQTSTWLRAWQNEDRAARGQLSREDLAGVHDQVQREFQQSQGLEPSARPPRRPRGSR
jgi:hypothetical protein